jgi:hypothetical protein
MKAGPLLLMKGMKGSTKQVLQIRMDEVPDAQIRNAFAFEIEPLRNFGHQIFYPPKSTMT